MRQLHLIKLLFLVCLWLSASISSLAKSDLIPTVIADSDANKLFPPCRLLTRRDLESEKGIYLSGSNRDGFRLKLADDLLVFRDDASPLACLGADCFDFYSLVADFNKDGKNDLLLVSTLAENSPEPRLRLQVLLSDKDKYALVDRKSFGPLDKDYRCLSLLRLDSCPAVLVSEDIETFKVGKKTKSYVVAELIRLDRQKPVNLKEYRGLKTPLLIGYGAGKRKIFSAEKLKLFVDRNNSERSKLKALEKDGNGSIAAISFTSGRLAVKKLDKFSLPPQVLADKIYSLDTLAVVPILEKAKETGQELILEYSQTGRLEKIILPTYIR